MVKRLNLSFFNKTPDNSGAKAIAVLLGGDNMRRVVHVGPTMARGGMSSVIQLLAANPPEGWRGSSCNTYSSKGIRRKLKRWRIAKKQIKAGDFDLVHIHCASDWSYRRKISIAKVAKCPVIFHIHSGKFDIKAKSDLEDYQVVCLSEGWSEQLRPLIGESIAVPNPVDAQLKEGVERENFTLLMGRNDPVKGHKFAFSLGLDDLRVTGVDTAPEGVTALGWVTEEEKWHLLQTAGSLIVPSEYEGQPMVILEALAAGCPVIASENIPDLPSCVKTAPLGDRDSWNAAISEPITENLEDYISNHLIENVRGLWGEIYDKIIDSNASTE